jgi:hypothetical protein
MSEFIDPFGTKGKLLPENIHVSQKDIDKSLQLQEQSAIQRHAVLDQEKLYTEKQRSYLRVLDLRKQLRLAEEQFTALYKEKPKEEPTNKKKEKSMVLREGEWVELEE